METATFAMGCFWSPQVLFDNTPGVTKTTVGYIGGTVESPTYEQVCTSDTKHAEAIQIEFDPAVVSYDALVDIFWKNHNPTTPNRQGPDIGSQYRSAIFVHSEKQKDIAEASKTALKAAQAYSDPIVTEIVSAGPFYEAEEYHQKYLEKRGQASCHI